MGKGLLLTGMTKSTFTSGCLVEHLYRLPFHLLMTSHNQLGNTYTIFDYEGLVGEVDQNHTHLTTIIGINGSGRV